MNILFSACCSTTNAWNNTWNNTRDSSCHWSHHSTTSSNLLCGKIQEKTISEGYRYIICKLGINYIHTNTWGKHSDPLPSHSNICLFVPVKKDSCSASEFLEVHCMLPIQVELSIEFQNDLLPWSPKLYKHIANKLAMSIAYQ